jgi:antitoxin CptB
MVRGGYARHLMKDALDQLDARRRRLLWRAEHRGTKEMDLVLGRFVRARIAAMDEIALDELEAIIATPDPDLSSWLIHRDAVPSEHRSATLTALLTFRP